MLSFLTQSTPTAPSAGAAAAAASAMFDDDFFVQRTRAAFPPLSHHGAAPHFPFGGFPVHHDPFGSKLHSLPVVTSPSVGVLLYLSVFDRSSARISLKPHGQTSPNVLCM